MISDILLHVDAADAADPRLRYALDLARRHGACLHALHVVSPVEVPPIYRPSLVEPVAAARQWRESAGASAAKAIFDAATADFEGELHWQVVDGSPSEEIAKQARWCDLVVVGQYEAEGTAERHPSSLAQDLVGLCGVPVLAVPSSWARTGIRHALIAWDGSRETIRAMHDAMPLLREENIVVEVATAGEERAGPTEPLKALLRRHGVWVGREMSLPSSGSIAEMLLARLDKGDLDLLVMGWPGRPAWLDLLFGGTAPDTLARAPVPVLLSR